MHYMSTYLSLFFLMATLPLTLLSYENDKAPQIIFLTGPSCSGKTTLAKILQEKLENSFLYLSLDQIIDLMPSKVNQWNDDPSLIGFGSKSFQDNEGHIISQIRIGSLAASMRTLFIDLCVTAAKQGHFLVIDDVFFESQDAENWVEGLQNFHVLWVKLNAPLEILEKREKERNNYPGCSRYQFYNLHQKNDYDLEIDTSLSTPESSANIIFENFVQRQELFLLINFPMDG